MDFSKNVIESFKLKAKRFKAGTAATLIAGAIAAPGAMQAGYIDIPDVFLTSDLSAGGVYAGHLVLGAADGLKAQDQLSKSTLNKVDDLREVVLVVREYLHEHENAALLDVQRMGYDQAINGGWNEVSLNSYIDTIYTDLDTIYDNVARADVSGLMLYPTAEADRDAQWHNMAAAKLIFDVSDKYMDITGNELDGGALVASVGNAVVATYETLGDGVGPAFSNTAGYTIGAPTIIATPTPEDVSDPFELTEEAQALLNEADKAVPDPFELTEEAKAVLEGANVNTVDRDPFDLTDEAKAALEEASYDDGPDF